MSITKVKGSVWDSSEQSEVYSSGVSRTLKSKLEEVVSVKDFGAVGDGVTDDTAAIQAAITSSSSVYIPYGATFLCGALTFSSSVTLHGGGALKCKTGTTGTWITVSASDVLFLCDTVFDINYQDVTRGIRVSDNAARFTLDGGWSVKNQSSTTFARGIDVGDTGVTDFLVRGGYFQNISSTANSIVGDNNGSTRCIFFGGASAGPDPGTPSYGLIEDLVCEDVETIEDADAIHYNTPFTNTYVTIRNIIGIDVAKRVVKIQGPNAVVENITAEATRNAARMYAVVSLYNNNAAAKNITGVGKLERILDIDGNDNSASSLFGVNTGSASTVSTTQGSIQITKGLRNKIADVKSYNFDRTIIVNNVNGAIQDLDVSSVLGSCTYESIYITNIVDVATNPLNRVAISRCKLTNTDNTRRSMSTFRSHASNVCNQLRLTDVEFLNAGYSECATISYCDDIDVQDVTDTSCTSISLNINNCTRPTVKGVTSNVAADYGVYINTCTKGYVSDVKARSATNAVRVNAGNDNIVVGAVAKFGGTAVAIVGGATNVQTSATFTYTS